MRRFAAAGIAAVCIAGAWSAVVGSTGAAQDVTREAVPGFRNFARLGTTVACTGAATPEAMGEVRRLGFVSVINLREATENGADVDAQRAAAEAAGLRYVHLPLNSASPDPAVVDKFLAAIVEPAHQPALIHCASGNRASAMWMLKRMMVDGWDAERAGQEASALGLGSAPLREFVLAYAASRRR